MVKYFRFHRLDPPTATVTFMKYHHIAKFINRSVAYVYRICHELKNPKAISHKGAMEILEKSSNLMRFKTKNKHEFTSE